MMPTNDAKLKIPFKEVSRLKLASSELKRLYTRHLLLQEMVPKEVSLFILGLGFFFSRQSAFDAFHKVLESASSFSAGPRLLLETLEDRHVNGVIVCMLAKCYTTVEGKNAAIKRECLYWEAYTLLSAQDEASLSSMALFYKAESMLNMPFGQTETRRLYELAAAHSTDVYRPVFSVLGEILASTAIGEKDYTGMMNALTYYERGCALFCPLSLYGCSRVLATVGGIKRAELFLRQAADCGHTNAIAELSIRCNSI